MRKGRVRLVSSRLVWSFMAVVSLLAVGINLTSNNQTQAVSINGNQQITALVLPMAPTIPAIIDSPSTNSTVQQTPLVVTGTCQATLLVRINNNGQLAGSSTCQPDGTFTINIVLSIGVNVLTALNYDSYDQPGPASDPVTITVIEPVPSSNNQQATAIIRQAVGTDSPQLITSLPNKEPIFHGTALGPLAKLLGIDQAVTRQFNQTFAIILSLFTVSLSVLIFVILFSKRLLQWLTALFAKL
ncbi:MAG: hypothetical protein QG553_718 [Patescibacteria group bacterium]|nr:hypothetical protein [Patescibacteria group bacterium]